ncbi:MAG: (p)ppGpp synthetase, partial [Prochlorococcaceae cyanobacterium]
MLRVAPDARADPAADEAVTRAQPAGLARRPIHGPADYGVPLPEWLARCVEHVPPGSGACCPTDTEALLAAAFDFAFQLHQGQYRASG